MTSALRRTALAAALVALSGSALADVVYSIDFNELGSKLVKGDSPVELKSERGFNFSGAFLYASQMVAAGDVLPDDLDVGGFLTNVNRADPKARFDVVLSLDSIVQTATKLSANAPAAASAFPNQYFKALSFSLATDATVSLFYLDKNGNRRECNRTGGAFGNWGKNVCDGFIEPLDDVTTLTFSAPGSFFALDNLTITLTDPDSGGGTGGDVPEPAGYALVGMALLAAGAASRRRS